jgi:uncharacterized sulfatase
LRELHAAGRLDEVQERLLFAPARPAEELYDLARDPHELTNLAGDAASRHSLDRLRARLAQWETETGDRGRQSEPERMYDSDMAVYLGGRGAKQGKPSQTEKNIELMKRWGREDR